MSYAAIIAKVETRPHPNADALQLGTAAGYQVIVGKDTTDGTMGIVFPEGGQLSHEFCMANRLYRKDPKTGEPMGGYMEDSRRVRAVKLRGEVSEALWMPLHALTHFNASGTMIGMKEGDTLTEWAGQHLCNKYYTPATIRAMRSRDPSKRKQAAEDMALPKHYDTPQWREVRQLPPGRVVITEKVHGTSGRTGHVGVDQPLGALARVWNRCAPARWHVKPKTRLEYVTGTRNCVVTLDHQDEYRKSVARMIEGVGLQPGEVWYYEIAGFDHNGKSIMPPHHVGKIGDPKLEKALRRNYSDPIVYSYGCEPDGYEIRPDGPSPGARPRYNVWVYRITKDGRELTYSEIEDAVIKATHDDPDLGQTLMTPTRFVTEDLHGKPVEAIRERVTDLANNPGDFDHPREGVCIRIESTDPETGRDIIGKAFKHKSFLFCALEGIARNDSDYVDTEEVA